MTRAILTTVILLAGIGASQAQTTHCYPRIGAYSGQYEGQCPASGINLKWTVIENSIGAYGRNCRDEVWTYNRNERVFYNHRLQEQFAMSDCYEPTRAQLTNNRIVNINSSAVSRFHEGKVRREEIAQAQ